MAEAGELLEYAAVFGRSYGTPRGPVEEALSAGRDVMFDIDWQGFRQLRGTLGKDVVGVFIKPPSLAELRERLAKRGDGPNRSRRAWPMPRPKSPMPGSLTISWKTTTSTWPWPISARYCAPAGSPASARVMRMAALIVLCQEVVRANGRLYHVGLGHGCAETARPKEKSCSDCSARKEPCKTFAINIASAICQPRALCYKIA